MFEDRMIREEELLMQVAPLPVLSALLRSRVLVAAAQARVRRTQGRRALAGAFMLFCLLGWGTWTDPLSLSTCHVAETDPGILDGPSDSSSRTLTVPTASSSSSYCRRDMLISA